MITEAKFRTVCQWCMVLLVGTFVHAQDPKTGGLLPPLDPPEPFALWGSRGSGQFVRMDGICYEWGDTMGVAWRYRNPRSGDWIGIYPEEDVSPLDDGYLQWVWVRTGTQQYRSGRRSHGYASMTSDPVPIGEYRAWIVRRSGNTAPFPGVRSSTSTFLVSSTCCRDNPRWRHRSVQSRNCDWVGRRRSTRCRLVADNGVSASRGCPMTCQSCLCGDSPGWTYTVSSTALTCDWVARSPSARCGRVGDNGVRASRACQQACSLGQCTCSNNPYWRTRRGGRLRNCAWVGRNPSARCNLVGLDRTRARASCLSACNQCEAPFSTCPDTTNQPAVVIRTEAASYLLGECEGDCNDDDDCAGNLECYHRTNGYQSVPGCQGGRHDASATDFCIDPANDTRRRLSNIFLVDNNPLSSTLDECEGDCDHDSDCRGDLVCFHRDAGDYSSVPGCSGGSSDGSRTDYCIESDLPVISMVTHPSTLGLGLCEGDCDTDADCAGDLVCHQRGRNAPVPGCEGGDTDGSRTDYCIDPTCNLTTEEPSSAPSPVPTPEPSNTPTEIPSAEPSSVPTMPTATPSMTPSSMPSGAPSNLPSNAPSLTPSAMPTLSMEPSDSPTAVPSVGPSPQPSTTPTMGPSANPSGQPSETPTDVPSEMPSDMPSEMPSDVPSIAPTS